MHMANFLDVPIPGPTIALYGAAKICIERRNDGTYVITRCERIGSEEWRPVGTPEHYSKEYLDFLYHVDLSQLE